MTIGKKKAIALFPESVLGIVVHDMEVESDKNIGHSQGASRVPGAGGQEHFDNVAPNLIGLFFEFLGGQFFHKKTTAEKPFRWDELLFGSSKSLQKEGLPDGLLGGYLQSDRPPALPAEVSYCPQNS